MPLLPSGKPYTKTQAPDRSPAGSAQTGHAFGVRLKNRAPGALALPLMPMPKELQVRNPGFVWGAAGLLIYGIALLALASSLPKVGNWTIGALALLLLAHAAGLWMRRRLAWTFGIAFYVLTGLACVVLAAGVLYWGYRAFAEQRLGEGFGALGAAMAVGTAIAATPVVFLVGVASGFVARALLRARDSLEGARSHGARFMAVLGALASFAVLAWGGFEYFARDLPARNACAGGSSDACFGLSSADRPFSAGERREFIRHACTLGSDIACDVLMRRDAPQRAAGAVPATGGAPTLTKAEIDEVTTACRAGRLDVCTALARHLLAMGDAETAAAHLSFACSRSVRTCAKAAELLRERGQPMLAAPLHRAACDGGDERGCSAVLGQNGLAEPERRRVELRGCLQGADEVCDTMITRDFPGACNDVCSVDDVRAAKVCLTCARKAALLGDATRARAWTERSCAQGLKAACLEATASASAVSAPPPERPPPSATAPMPDAMRARLAEFMPPGCRVTDVRDDNGLVTITGLATSTDCVSDALRALFVRGAQPELLDIQKQGGQHSFRASLRAAALGVR